MQVRPNFPIIPGMIGDRFLLSGLATALLILGSATFGHAETIEFRGAKFYVHRVDPKTEKIELFWIRQSARVSPTFQTLEQQLDRNGKRLRFAMNGGMYDTGFVPTGLFISEGETFIGLDLKDAPEKTPSGFTPNFYLKPNGVFFVRPDGSAAVMESSRLKTSGERPRIATQSGPLLLAGGKIHPVFEEDSTSRLLRNGVGIDSRGRVVFACSYRKPPEAGRINLWGFSALFRDRLDCRDALYLDGDISTIFIRGETHQEVPVTNFFGPILAVTERVENAKPSP